MPRPGSNGRVTDVFGPRVNPVTGIPGFHEGEDTAPPGNVAPVTGTIAYKGYYGGWGNIIGIRQASDSSVYWWVAHCENLGDLPVGRDVTEGQYIAPCGTTGNSTGVHAHTERRVGGSAWPGTGTRTNPRSFYTSAAGGGGELITMEDDMIHLIRVIFDQGPSNAPGFGSTATIDTIGGFVKCSDGMGDRGALNGRTSIANVLGMKVTEAHVDANGWALAQLFKPVAGGVRLPDAEWIAALEASLKDDFAGVSAVVTRERVALEGRIVAAIDGIEIPPLTDEQLAEFVASLDVPTALEVAKATNDEAARRLGTK